MKRDHVVPGRVDLEVELQRKLDSARERIEALEQQIVELRVAKDGPSFEDPETRFRVLVENSPDVIMTLDRDGRIQFTNYARPGSSVEQMLGGDVLQYIDADNRDRYERAFAEVLEHGETRSLELEAVGSSWWLMRLIPIEHSSSAETVLVIATDFTERKHAEAERQRLEAQVRHAQKLESLGLLAGGIAHDFNNLLTGILGSASLAAMKLPEGSDAEEQVQRIVKAAEKAAELTNQMLAYAGKGRFVMGPTGLNELVQEIAPLLKTSVSKKATLREAYAENLPDIDGDRTQLQQVVMNLLTNAAEALAGPDGEVSIRTGAIEGDPAVGASTAQLFLEVSDTGRGMDEETQAKIFDPFFTTKLNGRGLGLAAVQGIVRAHRGSIRVDSKPHRGTTFTVLFPASNRRGSPILADETDIAPIDATGRILVVDDEENVRNVARLALQESGFDVLLASDGPEALELFSGQPSEIDAVLLDLSMPRMSGEETLVELRKIWPRVRVVLTSGYSEEEIAEKFEGKGLAGFVQKPFRASELVARIHTALTGAGRF